MFRILSFLMFSVLLMMGCRSTYPVSQTQEQTSTYAMVRPPKYVVFESGSARDALEIVTARQEKTARGHFRMEVALRNRGVQGFWGWFWGVRSRSMTIYATVDFYDAKGHHLQNVPRRALVLPLGETRYFEWLSASPDASSARVTFRE